MLLDAYERDRWAQFANCRNRNSAHLFLHQAKDQHKTFTHSPKDACNVINLHKQIDNNKILNQLKCMWFENDF